MRIWIIVGFIATAIMALSLPVYALVEAERMAQAQTTLRNEAIAQGQTIYAENCVVCHGADGQGIGAYPALTNEGVRTMEENELFKVIERGRYNTGMAAWGVHEGGVLNDMQIEQVSAMIQQGDWSDTIRTVEQLGLNPPAVIQVQVSAETLAAVSILPHGEIIARALPLYAANCSGCHGSNGEGTTIAPALNDQTLRSQNTEADLTRIIANGVPGTLMAGWDQALNPPEIDDLAGLIRYWDELPAGLLPQPNLPPIASNDAEIIAAGQALYSLACSNCHGSDGQGTRMAPALNTNDFLTNTNDQALKAIIAQGIPDTRMPAWGGRLTDEELNGLISFIRAWEPNAPAVAEAARGGPGNSSASSGTGYGQGEPGGGPFWLRWLRSWLP